MDGMTDQVRTAVRMELARRNQTQAEFARQIGLAPQYVSRLIRGEIGKVPEGWQKMLDALGLELIAVPKGRG